MYCVARQNKLETPRDKDEVNKREIREYDGRAHDILEVVYYESLKRELKTKPIYEFRYDERLKTKVEESTLFVCTLLCPELEHLKIQTRLIDEMFASEMGEYVFLM